MLLVVGAYDGTGVWRGVCVACSLDITGPVGWIASGLASRSSSVHALTISLAFSCRSVGLTCSQEVCACPTSLYHSALLPLLSAPGSSPLACWPRVPVVRTERRIGSHPTLSTTLCLAAPGPFVAKFTRRREEIMPDSPYRSLALPSYHAFTIRRPMKEDFQPTRVHIFACLAPSH
ncbi:unnamed protein product [Protopolystoma xenopodis]|uniref:Uncharacterized protein n=1 Tax=Protopolystoma xenopodis TaxID=117903 RepID=A0A448WGS1_9PLAT|nr:unnamed protein product [Protopolystoma xenopodis]